MSYATFVHQVKKNLMGGMFIGLLFAALAFVMAVFTTHPYVAETDYQLLQAGNETKDFYANFKSSEYLGRVLSEAIGSGSFLRSVSETGSFPVNYLPTNPKDALEEWRKKVVVDDANIDLGIMRVKVYGMNREEVEKVTEAIRPVLVEQNEAFRGGAKESLIVKVLTDPIVDQNPSVKELVLIVVAAFLGGIALYLAVRLLRRLALQNKHQHNLA